MSKQLLSKKGFLKFCLNLKQLNTESIFNIIKHNVKMRGHFSCIFFPLELGVEAPKVEVCNQPKDDESGELVLGVGGGGLQARFSEAKKALPKILREQEEKLALAKRFAMEQSVQHVRNNFKISHSKHTMYLCSLHLN